MLASLKALARPPKVLSELDHGVLSCIRAQLRPHQLQRWDDQIAAVCAVQHMPDGQEVELCRATTGSARRAKCFENRAGELLLAVVTMQGADGALNACVWCVDGELFSIEYDDPALTRQMLRGLQEAQRLGWRCELRADLDEPVVQLHGASA